MQNCNTYIYLKLIIMKRFTKILTVLLAVLLLTAGFAGAGSAAFVDSSGDYKEIEYPYSEIPSQALKDEYCLDYNTTRPLNETDKCDIEKFEILIKQKIPKLCQTDSNMYLSPEIQELKIWWENVSPEDKETIVELYNEALSQKHIKSFNEEEYEKYLAYLASPKRLLDDIPKECLPADPGTIKSVLEAFTLLSAIVGAIDAYGFVGLAGFEAFEHICAVAGFGFVASTTVMAGTIAFATTLMLILNYIKYVCNNQITVNPAEMY